MRSRRLAIVTMFVKGPKIALIALVALCSIFAFVQPADGALSSDLTAGTAGLAIHLPGYASFLTIEDDCERSSLIVSNCSSVRSLSAFTVATWLKAETSTESTRSLFYKGDGTTGEFHVALTQSNELLVQIGNSSGVWAVNWTVNTLIAEQEWRHVAVSWDGEVVKVYQNGTLTDVTSYESTNSMPQSGGNLLIGSSLDSGLYTNFFNGSLDEVRIYSTYIPSFRNSCQMLLTVSCIADEARTELQIYEAHRFPDFSLPASLISYLSFDVDGASSVVDLSENNNAAAVNGSATWEQSLCGFGDLFSSCRKS